MADDDSWSLKEDYHFDLGAECRGIIYHSNLNVILFTSSEEVLVFDVNTGTVLHRSCLSGRSDRRLQGTYLGDGMSKVLYTDGRRIGVRSDYNGVLLLDTILQVPIFRSEDIIKLELLLSEAILLLQCLQSMELPGVEHVQEVLDELSTKIIAAQNKQKKGAKTQKLRLHLWNTICLELPHTVLKLVCKGLILELKKQKKNVPILPIASAISERLNGLLPGLALEGESVDRALMFSEAARHETFSKWPHMNYKWALPDQMAQAGFYHQPNSTSNDRALCFICNVCLVCWEPTDEPWSEHERHSPVCPFVRGEYTHNVPMLAILATAPATVPGNSVDALSTTNVPGFVATASHNGFVNIWNVKMQLKREISFYITPCDQEINNKDSLEFIAAKNITMSFLPNMEGEGDSLQLTALSLVGPKQVSQNEEAEGAIKMNTNSSSNEESSTSDIRPSLICGVTVSMSNLSQLRSLENVWASDLAPSWSLIRAMNSVNTAASNSSLDIMKVAYNYNPTCLSHTHYLVVCDFHHKSATIDSVKDDENCTKESKKKDGAVSSGGTGTGTSASSNGNRQDNMYHEILTNKFLLEDVIEDVDAQITVGSKPMHFPPPLQYTASSSNGVHVTMIDIPVAQTSVQFDSNFNPINGEQFASTSDISGLTKKSTDSIKSVNSEPVVVQSVRIDAPESLRITHLSPTKDGKHLYVALCAKESTVESNQMDVDEDSELYTSKNYVYWDQNEAHCNGEIRNDRYCNALLLVYALDFSDKVVKISREPLWRQELNADQTPLEHVMIPLRNGKEKDGNEDENVSEEEDEDRGPRGLVALVCKDGVVRLLDLRNLRVVSIARPQTDKFVSAAYCNSLERLCISTSTGGLYFYSLNGDDESVGDKELDDLNMITETSVIDAAPSTSTSSKLEDDPIIANRHKLTNTDLKTLYKLTRFERGSPPYIATVSPCWSEMMQAQRQRRHPQHLHQAEDNTRTWRLQNDVTTWDEHIFELSLPRYYTSSGTIEHVDVRFTLLAPCTEVPNIQVTLLNMSRIGPSKQMTSVDDRIDFNIGSDAKNENQSILDEYLQNHDCEILCGPISLQRCMDLSDQYGSVTLTSPKLFTTRVKTLLVHIKAIVDPTKDVPGKSKTHESKPPTSKKLRIDETAPLLPGAIIERIAANAKLLETHIGCDWIYEVSITIRSLQLPSVPNDRQQRIAMLHSTSFINNLLAVACLEDDDKSPITQSLALDILTWVIAIRLTRLRLGKDNNATKAMQYETVHCVQKKLPELLRMCLLYAGRSIAHKCVKIILLCSEGLLNLDDSTPPTFEETVLNVLVSLLPSIVEVQWAGSLRWMFVLITRLLPLDVNHTVAQQCIPLIQKIASEISNRVNPYHSLLATRFGLYASPFETELFDMEPPVLPKFSSVPIYYSSAVTGEHNSTSSTSINCVYSQESFDFRDLLNLPLHSNNELVVPSKLKTLCANYNMKGLLEVEPLHFTCHSASDGTKMEKIDTGLNTSSTVSNIYDSPINGHDLKSINNGALREDALFPWTKLLYWPSKQALVVERMHSGARRFIVLDFGSPVLLTDFMIPCCSELVSLYIDIWTKSEEIDGIRLVVAGDIGTKPLVVNDLQPPPVCRYLKITTIGRYGLTATLCKIPLGIFYGHLGILPDEDYSEINDSQSILSNVSELSLQSTLEAQYNILSALSEEIQCRMGLATERLKQYLDPLLCAETPNVVHMQHFLQHQKNTNNQNKDQASSKILMTYRECIMFQNQLNVIRGVWRRLQSWQGMRTTHNASLQDASSDKLRILCETLLDVLLYTVYEIGPVFTIPTSLYDTFNVATCEKLFHSICVMTPAPRLQLHAVALLARMAGHQPWWGKFLASTLVNLFSSSASQIFPQDRVFILLTFLGRKSLISGTNKSSVIESMVSTLESLLTTLMYSESGSQEGLDITLIGWVLLFLSVCLDTTFSLPAADDSNHEKSKYQSGVLSRWEFIQRESAMQRKFVNANRSTNSRNYHRKLQKQFMRHKQHIHDLEQAKKVCIPSPSKNVLSTPALWSVTPSTHTASLSCKLEAALKTEERNMKKSLINSAKHIKDMLSLRKVDIPYYPRNSRSQATASTTRTETIDPVDYNVLRTLSHKNILPVAKGLINLILSNLINVDMFLLACKVVARLVVSTRPAIGLSDLMTDDQLLKLVKLATGESDSAWSSHAICCLLQDLLEGGKLISSRNFANQDVASADKNYPRPPVEDIRPTEEDGAVAGPSKVTTSTSSVISAGGTDESFVTIYEDTQDSVGTSSQANTSSSKSNGFTLASLWESDDSELDDFLDDILEHGKNYVKRGNMVISKLPTNANLNVSLAMDARLEYGVESGIEITLRKLSTIGLYNLPFCINASIHPYSHITPSSSTSDSPRQTASTSRNSSITSQNDESCHNTNLISSNLSMLTRCFDRLFSGLYVQSTNTNLEQVLQLWITLNMDVSPEVTTSNVSHFDSSVTPVLSLSSAAISGMINAYYWHPGVSLRAWCLALQCLTLASNQPLVVTRLENERGGRMPHMDNILGGMAGSIIRERNLGGMLLRLLSGSGLESECLDKAQRLAGPTVCTALQDFLVRLQMRCDVVTVDSGLGIALKELLLWLVYQLVQPNGAIASRRGPLDAQCKLIGSLLNLNFVNTDIGTPMSISECVADLVYTHVRSSAVGDRCDGVIDITSLVCGFPGFFPNVLGGDSRQQRPASWELLIVNLIKLVMNLVQTPLPDYSTSTADSQPRQNMSQTDESKAAEQTCSRNKKTWKPQVPCVADTVLRHEPTMMRLLNALSLCSGSSLDLLLGEGAVNGTLDLGDANSIPDATFELLTTLAYKASSIDLVLYPIRRYLSSNGAPESDNACQGVTQLSEPLLWYILRVLDNTKALSSFTTMGGMKIICDNLVKFSKSNKSRSAAIGASGSASGPTGVIAMMMQHLCNAPNSVPATPPSRKDPNAEVYEDGPLNFAPFGNISWQNPTAQPADVLIQNTTTHRRARTPAWSYHFYPDEGWVDLTITLPCAVLLREVELQPHVSSLSTCPSAVAIEISRDVGSALTPVCAPMPTAGLTYIHITLSKPEVVTVVLIRLYKPRDSPDVNLSQIRLLGSTAFGDKYYDVFDEEQLTKSSAFVTSLGWLRLLDQCLSVSTVDQRLCSKVLNSTASVEGLVEACINLLLLPAPFMVTQNLDRVLLHFGLHSRELGHNLITLLLNIRSNFHFQVTPASQDSSIIQMVVELLQQLCSSRDANTEYRVATVLTWLQAVSDSVYDFQAQALPPAVYVHSISSIIWKAYAEQSTLNYNLSSLLRDELFNSLYLWTLLDGTHSTLKQAIDAMICAMCYVRPSLFKKLLKNLQENDDDYFVSKDYDEEQNVESVDRNSPKFTHWYSELSRSSHKRLPIMTSQLLTVFAAARSPIGIQLLIESELPIVLIRCIIDFCKSERSKQENLETGTKEPDNAFGLTDSDKAGTASCKSGSSVGICMNDPDGIATVLEAFTYACSEGEMRDWLGMEGSCFWFELLSLLSSRPAENPSLSSSKYSRRNMDYANLECKMIKFLSHCCWCHPKNQKLLAIHLTDVLTEQKVPSNTIYFYGISGFTRRLILQLLLENEKVAVFVTSESYRVTKWTDSNQNYRAIPAHPAYPLGDHHQLLYMSTQMTVADILHQLPDTWSHMYINNSYKAHEANTSGTGRTKENWEQNMSLADTLSVAAGNTAKNKRAREAQLHRTHSQSRSAMFNFMAGKHRRDDPSKSTRSGSQQQISAVGANSQAKSTNNQYLVHSAYPNTQLPGHLTIAQLLALSEDNGVSLSKPCLYLNLRDSSKDPKDASTTTNAPFVDKDYRSVKSCLEVFSAYGGLTALARHLPLVYPEPNRSSTYTANPAPSTPEQTDSEWVKIEGNETSLDDCSEDFVKPSPRMSPPTPHVPPHSLAAFGLFLRLPNYSEVLLRDRKKAQCLLRLALGVTDDGDGSDILSSLIASTLPTLPFLVLKQLLDDTPCNTDDGLLLRRTMVEIGAVNLLLNCLSIFTHQSEGDLSANGTSNGVIGDSKTSANRSNENKQHYWAKGTGYGTGSTQQAWNVEQSLLRQRWEEEHVTILLHVFSSYIRNSVLKPSPKELPSGFADLLARSCLLPALSSYLRNDSVMDMARHIPLYRVILELIREMAFSEQLMPLLVTRYDSNCSEPSILSLLTRMKTCVDTYTHKINRTRASKNRVMKISESADEDEGLSKLIRDIQDSTVLVQFATAPVISYNEKSAGPSTPQPEIPLKSLEQRYLEIMKNLQFDTYEMIVENPDGGGFKFAVSYHFESNMRAAGDRSHPTRVKRLAQEAVTLSSSLPLSYSSSVFVRCDADRLDIMKVLITGPEGTPYANGCFEFDVYFPAEYPNTPMMINLETTGRRTVRFNPNLYNDGKVCLSVLNTWHGRPEEKWNAHTSSFLQVLVSIQSLILVAEPYFNEPGYERARGTTNGAQSSQDYNANVYQLTAKWAMLDQIRNPCPCFKEVIHTHFWLKRHEIVSQIEGWIKELESSESEGRSARNSCSLNVAALKRHYKMLREELNKLPTPDGLEDLAEPLASPGSPLETSLATPNTPPICPTADGAATVANSVPGSATTSNHMHHDIDTDVEMEKMVSKVCE